MALSRRKKDEQTSKTFSVHTGVFPFKVVAFNPTLKEQKKIGLNFEEEPSYIRDDQFNEGKKQFLATFWLSNRKIKGTKGSTYTKKNEKTGREDVFLKRDQETEIKEGELLIPLTFSISEIDQVSRNGDKTKFINKYGKGIFAESKEEIPEWFDGTDARVAKRGEEELMTFLFSYANLKAPGRDEEGDENVLEDPNELFKDDSELRDLVESLMEEGNEVRGLVGLRGTEGERGLNVRETLYRDFYQKHNQRSVAPFKAFINCENVSEKNKSDQLDRRAFKADYYEFDPIKLDISDAKILVSDKMDKPDDDGDSTDSPEMSDVDDQF